MSGKSLLPSCFHLCWQLKNTSLEEQKHYSSYKVLCLQKITICCRNKSWQFFWQNSENINKHTGLQLFPSDNTFSQGCNPFFLHDKFYREIFMPDSVKEIHRTHKSAQLWAIAKTYLITRDKTKIQSRQSTLVIFMKMIFMKFMRSVWTKNNLKKKPHSMQHRLVLQTNRFML